MNFLAPAAFSLAALIPVIIAMYLLKLRRTEREISSVYLWRRMVRDVEANAPWQRLRRNLLLILQLLFLSALIIALARPFQWAEGTAGQAAILILDSSASMGATDVSPNRLEAAKNQARQLVNDLADEARVTVIAAGSKAQVMVASTQDRRQANLALAKIRLSTGSSDLSVALELASALAARQPDTEIIVLSDGRVTLPERMALKGRLRYLPVGIRGNNQAISLFTLEPAAGGERLTAFVQVTNYAESSTQRRLAIYADSQLINVFDLDLPAKGQQAVLAEDLPASTRLVEARLSGQDDLPTDDRALAVPLHHEPASVTIVSEGNLFLETALALLPGIDVTMMQPGETQDFPPANLTILDGYAPITATLPAGNLLFIAPLSSTEYFTLTGSIEGPILQAADPADPLLAHVSLADVNVLDARRIPLPPWARPVVVGGLAGDSSRDSTPLLFAGEVDGRRVAVLAFDLHRSDLPLQVAFPLLMANLTGWLVPGSAGVLPQQVAPGAGLSFAVPRDMEVVTVTRPDGTTTRLAAQDGQVVYADTADLGIYRLAWGEGMEAQFTVNLFSPQESDIRPADDLAFFGSDLVGSAANQAGRREGWRGLALLSLGLLAVEWVVYQRSGLIRLRDILRHR